MISSYVSRKEITRCLAVSKHWRDSTLGSVILRRKFLLGLDPRNEYCSHAREDSRRKVPVLSNKPSLSCRSIHGPHSVILLYSKSNLQTALEIIDITYETLRSVRPSTFLFRPPLDSIHLGCAGHPVGLVLERDGGITFGELFDELAKMRNCAFGGIEGLGMCASFIIRELLRAIQRWS